VGALKRRKKGKMRKIRSFSLPEGLDARVEAFRRKKHWARSTMIRIALERLMGEEEKDGAH
jgi:metal-responsive CopG/Arc/MetJ family transcriptional regulator